MYFVKVIEDLAEEDRTFYYGKLGNFSITGFEMTISRDASSFIFSLYLPTGFLIVSGLKKTLSSRSYLCSGQFDGIPDAN